MDMNVIVTGYNGSGASAMCHYLMEYNNTQIIDRMPYEHMVLHAPDGVFDLEHKLLYNNNMHRSDEALKKFKSLMDDLNENDYRWCGGYQNLFGNDFIEIVDDYIESLSSVTFEGNWFNDIEGNKFDFFQLGKDTVKFLLRKPIHNFGKKTVRTSDQMILSFVRPEEFYTASKTFINQYMNLFKFNSSQIPIFDHLIKPSNIYELDKYFDKDTKVIIMERDLRDYFLYGKYIKPRTGNASKFPKDINDFVVFWRGMERLEGENDPENVLRVQLEDFVFRPDYISNQIETFLNLDSQDKESKNFSVDKTKQEIELYKQNKEWEKEVEILEKEFPHKMYKKQQVLER